MKQFIFGLIYTPVFVFALAPPTLASGFEGIIHSKGKYLDKPFHSKLYIKDLKVRLETIGWKGKPLTVLIYDIAAQAYFILVPSKNFVEGPIIPDAKAVAQGKKKKDPSVVKSGKKEIIAGLLAEQYIQKHDDGRINEFLETNELNISAELRLGLIPFVGHLANERMYSEAKNTGWELRKIQRWPDGSAWQVIEAIKIEHRALNEDLFKVLLDNPNLISEKISEKENIRK